MTKNTDSKEEMTKTLGQYGQGHCGQSLPPIAVLAEPYNQDVDDIMQEPKKKNKKKSRGDRKAQHKRRRLRRQLRKVNDNQNPTEPTAALINDANNDGPNEQQAQQIQVGRSSFR